MRIVVVATGLLASGCVPVLVSGETPVAWEAPENSWPTSTPPTTLKGEGYYEGQVIHDFRLQDQYGDEVALWQFYGLVTVVDISTMWCAPCRALAAGTEETWQDYQGDGFMYVTVLPQNLERGPMTVENLNEWAGEYDITSPVIADPAGAFSDPAVPQDQYPLLLVVDREMVVQHRVSPPTDENLREAIDDLLGSR